MGGRCTWGGQGTSAGDTAGASPKIDAAADGVCAATAVVPMAAVATDAVATTAVAAAVADGGAAAGAPAYLLEGGIDNWRRAGFATVADRRQPLEIMRQVQITAGALVLAGVLLGWLVAPGFFGLSAFVGVGLMFAGTTGWCGMANLLRVMPWNRRAAA